MNSVSPSSPQNNPTIGLIGAGAVGSILARALSQAGYTVKVIVDRSAGAAKTLAQAIGAERSGTDFALLRQDVGLLLIAVPDDQIPAVDRALGKLLPQMNFAGAAHTSGTLTGSALTRLAEGGVPVGSMHPLQTFPAKGPSPLLQNVYFALEGDGRLVPTLAALVDAMGGIPVEMPSEGKIAYHTAAVMASNFIPVLLREARELMLTAGIPEEQILPMLAPLMRSSLENCLKSGETQALTGPVARGDAATIQRHVNLLKAGSPGTLAIYRMLSLKALELALEKGLSDEAADKVQQVLIQG